VKRLIRLVSLLYPPAWRARYGAEFDSLLREHDASLDTLLDVLANASQARLRSWAPGRTQGGHNVPDMFDRRAGMLGVLGLAIMLPTGLLVAAAVLKYIVGVDVLFDAIEPAMTPIVTHPLGETVFVLAPYVAFVFAVVPVTRVALDWQAGRLSATVNVRTPALNLAVAVVSVALAAFMALYWVAENL
jgi:hypothetical protein